MKELDGNKIKKIRQDKNLTQHDVAEKMKLYDKTYARKEKTGDFNEDERKKLIEILRIRIDEIGAEHPPMRIVEENSQEHKNGNGNDLVAAKEETIATLKEQVKFLMEDRDRLRKELESNSRELVQYAQANHARIKTILECQKLLRSKVLKEPIETASEQVDKIYLKIVQETFDQ